MKDDVHKVKSFIQRGRRGWADEDTWGLNNYFAHMMKESLRHLANNSHGHPATYKNMDAWKERLLFLARAFEEYEQFEDVTLDEFTTLQKKYNVKHKWVPVKDRDDVSELKYENDTPEYRKELDEMWKRQDELKKDIISRMRGIFDDWDSLWD